MLAIIMTEMVRQISERPILPFNCVTYANELEYEYTNFEKAYASDFATYGINLNPLKTIVANFTRNARDFQQRLNSVDKTKYNNVTLLINPNPNNQI